MLWSINARPSGFLLLFANLSCFLFFAVCEQVLFKPSPKPHPQPCNYLAILRVGKPVIDLSFETGLKPVLFIIRLVKDKLDQAY